MKARRFPAKIPGVWCTLCSSNFGPTESAVRSHFRSAHGRAPTDKEIKAVLANKAFRSKTRSPTDPLASWNAEAEHNARWRRIISGGGGPGTGKRK